MTLDKDNWQERNRILNITDKESGGGAVNFESLTLDSLNELVEKNFINLKECQNCSPSISEIRNFMTEYPDFTAHGYAIVPERSDYGVSLEGVSLKRKPTKEERDDFVTVFRHADSFICNNVMCFCWYD